ncbi:MAG TPA: trigger factor [Candidatus Limnocylindria bacterium]
MTTVTTRPEPGSRVRLEIEVPADEVDRHFETAYRHLAARTRVPGFRPGKAPRAVLERYVGREAVLAEAVEHLVDAGYDAAVVQADLIPIDQPEVDIDPAAVREGDPVTFAATVAVRPTVTLGAYTDYPFGLEIPPVTDEDVEQVVTELRDQQATLRPVDDRGVEQGDLVAVSFQGTIDGEPFDGGSAERLPLVVGEDRMIPGWEDQLIGLKVGETAEFDLPFPDDYRVETLAGKTAHFSVTIGDLRERVLPELDDAFAASVGEVATLDALRAEIRDALNQRADAEARHQFGDRIIDFAAANASVELPEVMIANEVEIMRDELRARLAEQRIGLDQYLQLSSQTPEELIVELREPASRRVKTLLVLSAIAEQEGIDADEAEIDAEVARQLERYPDEAQLREYLGSRRGRSYLRMTLRNRTLVDSLIDRAVGPGTAESAEAEPSPQAPTEPSAE